MTTEAKDEYFSFTDAAWRDVDDTDALLRRISPIDGLLTMGTQVTVRERPMPMHEGARLLCITSAAWEPDLRICFLLHEGALYRLNGTSPPIHELNAKAPIRIDRTNVAYYLTFFCLFVHGEEGPFYVVHALNDSLLPAGFATATSATLPGSGTPHDVFRAPRILGQELDGSWRASALVYYSNVLFFADFLVRPTGMVDMVQDQALISDLPIRMKVALAPLRGSRSSS